MKKLPTIIGVSALIVAPFVFASPYFGHNGGGHMMSERFDSNQDGVVTQTEIDDARTEMLKKYDSDGDGKLNLEEWKALRLGSRNDRIENAFQYHDADGDSVISQEEFLAGSERMMSRHDKNADGKISTDEMGANCRGGRGEAGYGHHHRGNR